MQEQMAALKVNEYQPKNGQDPKVFNEQYNNYIEQLQSEEAQSPGLPDRPVSQQTTNTQVEEDREDENESSE